MKKLILILLFFPISAWASIEDIQNFSLVGNCTKFQYGKEFRVPFGTVCQFEYTNRCVNPLYRGPRGAVAWVVRKSGERDIILSKKLSLPRCELLCGEDDPYAFNCSHESRFPRLILSFRVLASGHYQVLQDRSGDGSPGFVNNFPEKIYFRVISQRHNKSRDSVAAK